MPKIVCVSDTHGFHGDLNVPEGDILIHAGDITFTGELNIIKDFSEWLAKQPHKHKIVVAGNHDFCFQNKNREEALKILATSKCIYLEDSFVLIDGFIYYGSPWTPKFGPWAFMEERGKKIATYWNKIASETDVLITHGPPHKILDKVRTGNVGCEELTKAVERIKPKAHIFGHIHEGYGQLLQNETLYVNAASCDAHYDPINAPIVIDIP